MNNQARAIRRTGTPIQQSDQVKLRNKLLRGKMIDFSIRAALPICILIVWQAMCQWEVVSRTFLPSPLDIAAAFKTLLLSGELVQNLSISFQRVAVGFAVGGGLGFLVGILIGFIRKLEVLLDPSIQAFRMIPHLALAPLLILWFGFGETSKIWIIACGAFFPMYINTFLGIRSVDRKLFEVAQVLSFSRTNQLFRLILPAALPGILLGLRLSVAVSWLGLVVAELVGSQEGIGFLINFGKQTSSPELIFVGVIIFAVVGKLVDSLVRLLESKWLQWRDNYKG